MTSLIQIFPSGIKPSSECDWTNKKNRDRTINISRRVCALLECVCVCAFKCLFELEPFECNRLNKSTQLVNWISALIHTENRIRTHYVRRNRTKTHLWTYSKNNSKKKPHTFHTNLNCIWFDCIRTITRFAIICIYIFYVPLNHTHFEKDECTTVPMLLYNKQNNFESYTPNHCNCRI